MQKKIVLDTNVLVSAAISQFGYASRCVILLQQVELFLICTSINVLIEYEQVSKYARIAKKYAGYTSSMSDMIDFTKKAGQICNPTFNTDILKDPSDNKFLDLAYACQADYLITGNHLDFTITEFHQTKIVNPKMFWELFENEQL